MNALVESNGQTISHLMLSELTGKRQDSVKRTMETLKKQGVITYTQIVEVQNKGNNRSYKITTYHVEERDSYIVVAQLCPEYTAKLVDFWMEHRAQKLPAPTATNTDTHDAIVKLMDLSERFATQFMGIYGKYYDKRNPLHGSAIMRQSVHPADMRRFLINAVLCGVCGSRTDIAKINELEFDLADYEQFVNDLSQHYRWMLIGICSRIGAFLNPLLPEKCNKLKAILDSGNAYDEHGNDKYKALLIEIAGELYHHFHINDVADELELVKKRSKNALVVLK